MSEKVCGLEGCSSKFYANGLCEKHYQRRRKFGSHTNTPQSHGSLEDRFWRKVLFDEPDNCWVWQGQIMPNGYGGISRGGRHEGRVSAHRAVVEIITGERVPRDKVVMHLCDNPPCVNPKHLRVGTYIENTEDMISKGRHKYIVQKGELSNNSKLTTQDVLYIRSQPLKTHAALARELGVGTTCIRSVRNGRTWSHVK